MHTPPGFLRRFTGVFLSAVIAAPIVISTVASGPAEAAGTPLYPNLKTLPARELRFDRADISAELSGDFHNVLRFSNDTYNAGDGPLIVNGKVNLSTLRGPSSQRVLNSDGTYSDYNLNNELYWHEAHHHYHFDNWGDYQLWSKSTYDSWLASGRTSGSPLYGGAKTTSCIVDEEFITSAPNAVYPGGYGLGGCQTDGQGNIRMGLSVGWGDTYDWYRQLQWIDLGQGSLGNGTYVLRSVADPLNLVYESENKSDTSRESVDDNEATTTFIVNNGSIIDSDAPTGTVAINHVDPSTNNAAVSVDVIGRDDVSTVNQFRLSNDGVSFKTFSYQSSGSAPTTVAWNLTDSLYGGTTANGLKTVYAQARDSSGKWGPVFTDTITYGSGGPPPPPPPPPPNGPYPDAVMGDNPGGYWRLNETSGISAGDSFGSNPGTYKNGVTLNRPSLLVSDPDKAASFASATKQHVSIPSSGPIAPASRVTVEAWIKPTTVPASGFASIATKPESYSLQFNGGKLEFTIMQSGVRKRLQAPAGAVVANSTYYVVGTYDGTTQRLYINGTQVASAALTGGITSNVSALNIGSWDGGMEFFNGVIDEVAVYPIALSASQIAVHRADGINTGGTQAQLSISRSGSGGGNVTSVPAGVDCGTTCSHQFAAGTSVTLTAAPTGSSTFAGWSGGGCSGTGTCTMTLNSNTSVNAAFSSPANPALTVAKSGTGTGLVTSSPAGINCGSTCSASFASGTVVTLTATPDSGSGSTFTGWSGGGCSGTGTCAVTLNSSTSVTAGFSAPVPNPTLGVAKSGTGTGSVTSSPAGINCGSTCSTSFAPGTVVTLTATANSGSTFTGWSGGGCSGTGTCTVTLNANTSVTAAFSLPAPNPTLSVAKSGTGTGVVTSNPAGINCGTTCSTTSFPAGTVVTLTASPGSGSTFTGWSGACSGTGTCTVTMSPQLNTSVTAGFAPTSSGGTYAQAVTGDAPAGYWKLNETSGTNAVDSTATSNGTYRGTTLGAPGLLASPTNKAATFSGTNSAVNIPSKTALSPSARVTLEAWIKPTALPATGAFASVLTKAESYSLQFNGPRLEFTIMQSGTRRRLQAPVGAIAVGGTYHVVGTYDGATQRLYINGVSVASVALTGAITVNTTAVTLASWGTGEYFRGTIDEAAVYSTALTAAKVTTHYNAGITSLVAAVQMPASAQLVALSKLAASRHGAVGGTTPVAIAYDNALRRAYVTHKVGTGRAASSAVTIFDTLSWKAIAEVVTSPTPVPSSIAVDPVTHLVYVTAAVYEPFEVSGSVKVLDGRTGKIVDSIATGPGPKAIAVNPTTRRVYVTAQTGTDSDLAITVIDGTTGRLMTTVPIGPYGEYYDNPFGIAVNAKTNKVYASNPLDGFVYTLDGATNTIMRSAPVGGEPGPVAVNAVTNKLFVTGAHNITLLDGSSGKVQNRIAGVGRTRGVAVDASRNKIYATSDGGGLLVIDGRTLKTRHLITHGRKPNGIAIDRSGTIVVANGFNANVSVYSDDRAVGTS